MTRRHFVDMAAAIHLQVNAYSKNPDAKQAIYTTTKQLCQVFKKHNPAFKEERFLLACGFDA